MKWQSEPTYIVVSSSPLGGLKHHWFMQLHEREKNQASLSETPQGRDSDVIRDLSGNYVFKGHFHAVHIQGLIEKLANQLAIY